MLKKAREEKNMIQEQLAQLVDKKRTYISRVGNDGSNLTLKTLYDIVGKGLGGKVKIQIELWKYALHSGLLKISVIFI